MPTAAISADGEYLYHQIPAGVLRSRVSDGVLIDRIRNPVDREIIRIASDDSFLVSGARTSTAPLSLIRLR